MADIMKILPEGWDKRPLSLASEIRSFLESVKDEGTSIDSGTDGVTGDLWVTVQGVSYTVCVFKTGSMQMCATEKSSG